MKRGTFDVRHPAFAPLWRRVALAGLTTAWAVVEASMGAAFWAAIFGAGAAFLIWEFFIVYDPANYQPKDEQ